MSQVTKPSKCPGFKPERHSVCLETTPPCDTEPWFSNSGSCRDPLEGGGLVTHIAALRLEDSELGDLRGGSSIPIPNQFPDATDAAAPWAARQHKARHVASDRESGLRQTRSRTRFSVLNCVLRTPLAFRGALARGAGIRVREFGSPKLIASRVLPYGST